MASAPIVYALDFPSLEEARAGALAVRDTVGMLKVGLELFVEAGSQAVALGAEAGLPVFLDLKLHDIPETVERAVARASALGARVATVHASGGLEMLRRAVERATREGAGLEVAAITVLTSLDASDLASIGFRADLPAVAERLARLAYDAGVRSFVCSAREAAALRLVLGPSVTLYTPGVRPASGSGSVRPDDQKRVLTAGEAIRRGADWLIVGRPIRDAPDPAAAAQAIAREIEQARAAKGPA